MTLVFSTTSGQLNQVQVGPIDVVSIVSTAYSAYGWVGGLDGVRFLFSKVRGLVQKDGKIPERSLESLLDRRFRIQNSSVHALTSTFGPVQCQVPNSEDAFGGERSTQLVGLTICALAHELRGSVAVDLFTGFLAPTIFEGAELVLDALHAQLREEDVLQRILNEGTTRGLSDLFIKSVVNLGLPVGDVEWLRKMLHSEDDMSPLVTETHMVAGLLRWIVYGQKDIYYTRSGLVARVASYLKTAGYNFGSIQIWDGSAPRPRVSGPNSVILVLGGIQETDQLMAEPEEIAGHGLQQHYTSQTVGSMLYHTVAPYGVTRPEVLQSDFNFIFDSIKSQLQVSYRIVEQKGEETLRATFRWFRPKRPAGSLENSLAAIYFPLLSEYLAPCYSRIATETILEQVLDNDKRGAIATYDGLTEEVARFRTVTAAIVISLISRLSSTDFGSVRHCTMLELGSSEWLEESCSIINRGYSGSLSLNEAVHLLAAIHVGVSVEPGHKGELKTSRIIGRRSGMYCVLPSLLLNMRPDAAALNLVCGDIFYANIRAHPDGTIRSSITAAILVNTDYIDSQPVDGEQQSVIGMMQNPWLGPARRAPPNMPLHLSIERPLHYSDPDVCFAGRVDGAVIGTVSVIDVLLSLAWSIEVPSECNHNDGGGAPTVLNVSASTWAESRHVKPIGTAEYPAYLAVQGDPAWGLFAAGQCRYSGGCVVLGCFSCSKELVTRRATQKGYDNGVLIGYN